MTAETSVLPAHPARSGTLPAPGTYRADPGRCILEISASFGLLTTLRGRFAVLESRLEVAAEEHRSTLSIRASAGSLRTTRPFATRRLIGRRGLAVRQHRTISFASTGFEAREPDRIGIPGELGVRGEAIPLTLHSRVVGQGRNRLLIIATAQLAYSQLREQCSFHLPWSVPAGSIRLLLAADFR
jgi:polyisoprenoid-binding protein YceI